MPSPAPSLIGAGLADQYGLGVGDPLRLQVNDQLLTVTVAGLLTPSDANRPGAPSTACCWPISPPPRNCWACPEPDTLSRIDLILTDAQAAALAARLPAGICGWRRPASRPTPWRSLPPPSSST